MKHLFISLFLLISLLSTAQEDYTILRQPALSPDGSMIAFSYQGDIWTVPASGGKAIRLTIHEAYESSPQWSPDGETILFTSERNGNGDIYTIGKGGSDVRRITYHSAGDGSGSWLDNSTIVFSTSRNFRQVEREGEFHSISANGGTPERILNELGSDMNVQPGKKMYAFVRGGCRIEREAYRGPANRDIWIYNPSTKKYLQVTADDGQDVMPEWGAGNNLYFLSARSGRYNIYKTEVISDGSSRGEITALTNFKNEGIRNFDVSADGSKIVFVHEEKIIIHDVKSKKNKTISIEVGEDYRFDPVQHETVSDGINNYALSPDEKFIAYTANGDLFFKQNDKEKARAINPLSQPSRETKVEWFDNKTAMFLSDRNGTYDIFSLRSTDEKQEHIFHSFKWEITPVYTSDMEVVGFEFSPDHKKIAILEMPGTLMTADLDSMGNMSNMIILSEGWDMPSGLQWSPDGHWLAYSLADLNFNNEVYIHKADGSLDPVNVSMHPRTDRNPVWSPDGSKLGFLSIRNNGDSDVWFAWLREEDYEKTQRDWEEDDSSNGNEKKDEKEGDEKEEWMMEIDLEDIHERLVQVTRIPGNEGDLAIDGEGELFMFSTNNGSRAGSEGKSEYMKVKWNGEDLSTLIGNGNISQVHLDKKGKALYYTSRGKLAMVDIKSGKSTNLPHSGKMDVETAAYRKQVFDEAWRTIQNRFYDPEFHGQDWNKLRKKYEPRAMAASTNQDFRMLFNEMLGQINASHMGLYGSGPEETQNERTGLLGIEIENHSRGVEITSIIPESPADREESKLFVGEVITAVNNKGISQNDNFYSMLNGKANERVLLQILSTADTMREVIIRPVSSLSTEKYEAWVDARKALTDQYSNGKLGYIHIRGMNWPSFERFERELMASGYGKEGIVIDVRYNGGGWTTDMVMAVLNVRQHAYTVPRGATDDVDKNHKKFKEYYPYGERLPFSSLTKPRVALCNESSYSNAEIFSHAFKHLGHGSLVGQPTFGAVISTGGAGLMDGSFVRVPFRGWYVKATEENMEWGPAVPDYIVENLPEAKANNEDQQLKKAVEVLLSEINN